MKDTDQDAFRDLILMVGEYYRTSVSKAMTEVYWYFLAHFELVDIRRAFKAHGRHPDQGRYFPRPADIVRLLEGSSESRALKAWAIVEKSMSGVGRYQSVVFDDALIHAVIEDMGGWIKLCEQSLKELPFTALDFQKRYSAFVTHKPLRHPSCLVGICERDNAKDGYPITPPVLIGNRHKAETVLKSGGGNRLEVHQADQVVMALIQSINEVQQEPESADEKS